MQCYFHRCDYVSTRPTDSRLLLIVASTLQSIPDGPCPRPQGSAAEPPTHPRVRGVPAGEDEEMEAGEEKSPGTLEDAARFCPK